MAWVASFRAYYYAPQKMQPNITYPGISSESYAGHFIKGFVMNYACVAVTGMGARCRNWVDGNVDHGHAFCAQHNAMVRDGGNVDVVGVPNAVLMVFLEPWKLEEDVLGRLIDLGVPMKEQDRVAKQEKHAQHAEQFNRSANRFRPNNPDSGAKVFDEKLKRVSARMLYCELLNKYAFCNPHVQTYPGQPHLNRLVIAFGDKAPENGIPELSEQVWDALDEFTLQTFRTGEVWANPPRNGDGAVIHSVKLSAPVNDRASWELEFNDGLYVVCPK